MRIEVLANVHKTVPVFGETDWTTVTDACVTYLALHHDLAACPAELRRRGRDLVGGVARDARGHAHAVLGHELGALGLKQFETGRAVRDVCNKHLAIWDFFGRFRVPGVVPGTRVR